MKISIIGCGYVGLVTGACLAELGHEVLGVDDDPEKLRTLLVGRTGTPPDAEEPNPPMASPRPDFLA